MVDFGTHAFIIIGYLFMPVYITVPSVTLTMHFMYYSSYIIAINHSLLHREREGMTLRQPDNCQRGAPLHSCHYTQRLFRFFNVLPQ